MLVSIAALLLLGGCAAVEGRRAPHVAAGSATEADVEIAATAGSWRGWPSDLSRFVTPIHVSVVNHRSTPVPVRYEDFTLVPATGWPLVAVRPQDVRGVVYEPPPAALPSAGFALGAEGYPWEPDWVMRGPAPGGWSDPVARVGQQFPLPTPDMLIRALPEEVLEPGGAASGFVYFERDPERAGPARLTARLIDARTGQSLGRAVIPLVLP